MSDSRGGSNEAVATRRILDTGDVGTAGRILKRRSDGIDNVMIGTPIRHDHANYVLMYDMLTGIRIAVSPPVQRS